MTIQNEERDVEYGDAVKGDETIALWARMEELGGTEAGRPQVEGVPPLVYILGVPVLVGLILLCCSMAFKGAQQSSVSKTFANRGYLADDDNSPQGPSSSARTANAGFTIPKTNMGQSPVTLAAPAPMPIPSPASPSRIWSSALERDRVTELLSDCRVAYNLSGELSQRWLTSTQGTVIAMRPGAVYTTAANTSAADKGARPLTNQDWNAIDGEMDAIAGTIGIAAQPSRYPEALQDTSMEMGREMRTFLQTTRAALLETDPQLRNELQTRANNHRARAGELLSALEASTKDAVAVTPPY